MNGWAGDHGRRRRAATGSCGSPATASTTPTAATGSTSAHRGDARYRAEIRRNRIRDLEEGPDLQSLLAIGLQTATRSSLVANLDGNARPRSATRRSEHGSYSGADTEGIFVNPVGPSRIDVVVKRNTYTNPDGLGGFSANGMEMVSMGDGSTGRMVDPRQHLHRARRATCSSRERWGRTRRLDLRLDRRRRAESTRAASATPACCRSTTPTACSPAASVPGTRSGSAVRRTTLTNCANNGLSIGSNGGQWVRDDAEHRCPTFVDSRITGNRGANLAIRNFTGARASCAVSVERTDLSDSHGGGSGFANVEAEDLGDDRRVRDRPRRRGARAARAATASRGGSRGRLGDRLRRQRHGQLVGRPDRAGSGLGARPRRDALLRALPDHEAAELRSSRVRAGAVARRLPPGWPICEDRP